MLSVPPTTRTAREGVAWTFGLGSWEYRPSRETQGPGTGVTGSMSGPAGGRRRGRTCHGAPPVLEVFGELLPLALGVAVSPVPVMIVVLMLIAPGGLGRAGAFVAGWFAGLLAVGGVVLAFVEVATEAEPDDPGMLGTVIPLALGALLLALAAREWRNRPGPGDAPALPGWMSSLDGLRPGRALALGFTFAAIKPKNLVLAVAAGTSIAAAGLAAGPSIVLLVAFALLAVSTVAAPLVVTLATGERAPSMLEGWRAWLEANNTVITVIVLLVFGTVLIGKGIGSLG